MKPSAKPERGLSEPLKICILSPVPVRGRKPQVSATVILKMLLRAEPAGCGRRSYLWHSIEYPTCPSSSKNVRNA